MSSGLDPEGLARGEVFAERRPRRDDRRGPARDGFQDAEAVARRSGGEDQRVGQPVEARHVRLGDGSGADHRPARADIQPLALQRGAAACLVARMVALRGAPGHDELGVRHVPPELREGLEDRERALARLEPADAEEDRPGAEAQTSAQPGIAGPRLGPVHRPVDAVADHLRLCAVVAGEGCGQEPADAEQPRGIDDRPLLPLREQRVRDRLDGVDGAHETVDQPAPASGSPGRCR